MIQYKTFIRVRPDTSPIVKFKIGAKSISLNGAVLGTYDGILLPRDDNLKIFQFVKSILDDFLRGYNGCIMTFGCGESGKSHTLFGDKNEKGIVELAFEYIFDQYINKRKYDSICRIAVFCVTDEVVKDLFSSSNENMKCNYDFSTRSAKYTNLKSHICVRPSHALDIKNASDNSRNLKENQGHVVYKVIIETRYTTSQDLVQSKYRELDIIEINYNHSASLFDFMAQMKNEKSPNMENSQSNLINILGNLLSGNCKAALICHVQLSQTSDTKEILAFVNTLKQLKCNPIKKYFIHQDENYYVKLNNELDELINSVQTKARRSIENRAPTSELKNCLKIHDSIKKQLENLDKFSSNRKDMEIFSVQLKTIITNWNATRSMLPIEECRAVNLKDGIPSAVFSDPQNEISDLEIIVRRLKQTFVPAHLTQNRILASNFTLGQDDTLMNSTALLGGGASFMNPFENKENQISKTINYGNDLSGDSLSSPLMDKVVLKEVINSTMYQEINPDLDTTAFKCEHSFQDLDNKKWKSYQTKRVLVITRETQTC